jgi:putative transposase
VSRNYKFKDPAGLYFVSFATVHWVDVFVRRLYFDCLTTNLNCCANEHGMEVFAWCIMPSHVHLVFRTDKSKPENLIGGFKSVTSRQLINLIANNPQESRREWLLNAFAKAGSFNSNNIKNQFWQQHNKPIQLWSSEVIQQKIDYVHNNPVVAGFVESSYEYLYSSARDYNGIKGLVNLAIG